MTSCHVHHTYTKVLNIVQNKWEDCSKLKNLDPRCKIHNHVHLRSKSWTCYYSWWGQGQQVWKLQIRGTKKVSPLRNPKVMKMLSPEGSSGSPCVSDTSQNQSKLLSTLGDWHTQTVEWGSQGHFMTSFSFNYQWQLSHEFTPQTCDLLQGTFDKQQIGRYSQIW